MPDALIEQWRAALGAQGLRDRAAQRMARELADHQTDLITAGRARGLSRHEASEMAKEELGDCQEIALLAAFAVGSRPTPVLVDGGTLHLCGRWLLAAVGGAMMTTALLFGLTVTLYA